jgi:hypothetical protein
MKALLQIIYVSIVCVIVFVAIKIVFDSFIIYEAKGKLVILLAAIGLLHWFKLHKNHGTIVFYFSVFFCIPMFLFIIMYFGNEIKSKVDAKIDEVNDKVDQFEEGLEEPTNYKCLLHSNPYAYLKQYPNTGALDAVQVPDGEKLLVQYKENGWGKTSYSGIEGWVFLGICPRIPEENDAVPAEPEIISNPASFTCTVTVIPPQHLNMRVGPGRNYVAYDVEIHRDEILQISATSGAWYKTTHNDLREIPQTGWISSNWCK